MTEENLKTVENMAPMAIGSAFAICARKLDAMGIPGNELCKVILRAFEEWDPDGSKIAPTYGHDVALFAIVMAASQALDQFEIHQIIAAIPAYADLVADGKEMVN